MKEDDEEEEEVKGEGAEDESGPSVPYFVELQEEEEEYHKSRPSCSLHKSPVHCVVELHEPSVLCVVEEEGGEEDDEHTPHTSGDMPQALQAYHLMPPDSPRLRAPLPRLPSALRDCGHCC